VSATAAGARVTRRPSPSATGRSSAAATKVRPRPASPSPSSCAAHPLRDRTTLALVLRDEVRRGRVDYLGFSRRYRLNGGLPDDVKLALRELEL
jgi:hypothetical protein